MPKVAGPRGKISLDMTPLIDVVFQLLTFFVMTLNIVPAEGELDLQMPRSTVAGTESTDGPPTMTLVLKADAAGDCSLVQLNQRSFTGAARWDELHRHVVQIVGDGEMRAQARLRLVCDANLDYQHTMDAISAVSGSRKAGGDVTPLIEQIEFVSTPAP